MIEHTFREIRLRNGQHQKMKRIIEFADPQYDLAAAFFAAEADTFRSRILNVLAPVEAGETDEASFAGNQYGFALYYDQAVIYDQMKEPMELCQMDQEDFLALIREWYGIDQAS